MRLRVATYNVRSFRGGVDAAVEALEGEADVVLVQECGPRRQLRRFAGSLGLQVVSSHRPFGRVRNAVCFPRDWRLIESRSERLPRQGRAAPRGFAAARLRSGTVRLLAASAHLGLAERERRWHARELTDRLLPLGGVLLLGADLNEGPEAPAARWVAERLYDAFARAGVGAGASFPAAAPTARIDYLLVGAEVTVLRCWVPVGAAAARASDHRPVLADVEVPDGS